MKVKVIADGTAVGTKLLDAETNEPLAIAIMHLGFYHDVSKLPVLHLHIASAGPVELETEAHFTILYNNRPHRVNTIQLADGTLLDFTNNSESDPSSITSHTPRA